MVALVVIQNVGNDGFDPKDVANISDTGTSNSNMFNKITTGNPTKKKRFGPFNHHTYLAHEAGTGTNQSPHFDTVELYKRTA